MVDDVVPLAPSFRCARRSRQLQGGLHPGVVRRVDQPVLRPLAASPRTTRWRARPRSWVLRRTAGQVGSAARTAWRRGRIGPRCSCRPAAGDDTPSWIASWLPIAVRVGHGRSPPSRHVGLRVARSPPTISTARGPVLVGESATLPALAGVEVVLGVARRRAGVLVARPVVGAAGQVGGPEVDRAGRCATRTHSATRGPASRKRCSASTDAG